MRISGLGYIYDRIASPPITVDISAVQSDGFLNLTILNATEVNSNEIDFTAVLVADAEELFRNGYRCLKCGSVGVMDNVTFSGLDMDGMVIMSGIVFT